MLRSQNHGMFGPEPSVCLTVSWAVLSFVSEWWRRGGGGGGAGPGGQPEFKVEYQDCITETVSDCHCLAVLFPPLSGGE